MYVVKCFFLLLAFSALCASQSKDDYKPNSAQQNAAYEHRPSDNVALVIKVDNPSSYTQPDPKPNTNNIQNDKRNGLTIGDEIAIGVGILQFIILVTTVTVMVVNGRRQLRAYVLTKSGSIAEVGAGSNIPGVALWVENGGQTPAYKLRSWVGIAVIPVRDENQGPLAVRRLSEQYSNTLGPGIGFNKHTRLDRPLTASEITEIGAGTRAIYVFGRVEYRDAFKKQRFSNIRLHYSGQWPPPNEAILYFGESGNDAD
jgi:hypothetical protein